MLSRIQRHSQLGERWVQLRQRGWHHTAPPQCSPIARLPLKQQQNVSHKLSHWKHWWMSPQGGTTHITCPMLQLTFITIYLIWEARNSRVMLIKLHLNISIFQYFRAGSYFHITDCFCLFTFIDSKGVSNFTLPLNIISCVLPNQSADKSFLVCFFLSPSCEYFFYPYVPLLTD